LAGNPANLVAMLVSKQQRIDSFFIGPKKVVSLLPKPRAPDPAAVPDPPRVIMLEDFDFESSDATPSDSFEAVLRQPSLARMSSAADVYVPHLSHIPIVAKHDELPTTLNQTGAEMRRIHHQFEVLERRINNGDDKTHLHPAMAVRVLLTQAPPSLTNTEKCLAERYDVQPEVFTVPNFWPPRVYDDKVMSLDENDTGIWQMPLPHKKLLAEPEAPEVSDAPPRRKIMKKPPALQMMVLRLPTRYFDTDASDQETDWDDF
jgi:hypothetical protein